MYDTLVNFIGEVPDACVPFLYLASIVATLYVIDQVYSFLRIFISRWFK